MGFLGRIFGAPQATDQPVLPNNATDEGFLPSDARQLLVRYARQLVVPRHEDLDAHRRIVHIQAHMYMAVEADPTALYSELASLVGRHADWVAVGAAWFIKDLGVPGYQGHPIACGLMELATCFLRSRNIPFSTLAPIQQNWWRSSHPDDPWLTYPPLPDRTLHPIADLEPDQERPIVRFGPMGNNNVLTMKRELDGTYTAYIDSPREDDPTRFTRNDWRWKTNSDRYNLAVDVTNGFLSTPQWVSPDLVPYMLPAPDYS